jgi:hypothetical protein|tara:strand:+ start:292 stop:483 length:192 start_codon:yes stop_codon:yes gene_type:complete
MIPELEKLWELADEQLEQHEVSGEEASEPVRTWYHEGWTDAMKWLMDILEEALDEENENSDEW